MNFQDALAPAHIRSVDHHAPVKTARAEKCGIEYVRTVRRGYQDHAFVRFKPVHFDEQLIQRLLALVMSAAETSAAVPSDRVDFIDKDNARRILFALLEQVAHAARTHAHKHFDEV